MNIMDKIAVKFKDYSSLVKIAHTVFALPFAMLGFFYGYMQVPGSLSLKLLLLVLLCMVTARNAAMSFNRYADRHIDKLNPRTAMREIPAEIIKPGSALTFCIINCLLFITLTWFINPVCFFLSPVALAIITGYSFTKRFTSLAHFILGLGLALAPTGAFLAVTGKFDIVPVLISLGVLFWVTGFDILYALQDEEFDRENKLRSIPVAIGRKHALTLSLSLHLVCAAFIVMTGIAGHFHILYFTGLLIFFFLLFYQHVIVNPNDISRVNMAFFTLNGIASMIYAVFGIADLFFPLGM
jgi:4-hydroxybenzoate polyprenyltransferase